MNAELGDLGDQISAEFDGLLDYIWKSPNFIENEIKTERQKLDAYFPEAGNEADREQRLLLRKLRAHYEGENLFGRFPKFMASSNLFLSASLFEHFLLRLCRAVETHTNQPLSDQKGNGVDRYLRFLGATLGPLNTSEHYTEVGAAIVIRNALLHADGEIEVCRNRVRLQQIVSKKLYLARDHRAEKDSSDSSWHPTVSITGDPARLKINNDYSYIAAAYLKKFLLSLTKGATAIEFWPFAA